ncbi:alpha/beta hydrolase [Planococcus lenghuensis]|uniref:Esterase n=1 Tax=Planococcus lenghuensis TaxID=2213202 RepID=A0A1Q2L2N0_9BACL|nr:alpha/beta hydrolase-fold protein [Planococcus lenghuensis]AQQ54691.1 esterase [Planococcus lenghuensis]
MVQRLSFLLLSGLVSFLVLSGVGAWHFIQAADGGTVLHRTFQSEVLGRGYNYNIYIPEEYDESEKHYPVLYLLHGSFGNEHNWVERGNVKKTADRLIESGEIPPSIIVMPGSRDWWIDGYNERAGTAFVDELIPHIDGMWRTIPERDSRLIAGLSAGGYGTVNFILDRPDLFAAAAALSPAVYAPRPPATSTALRHPTFMGENGQFDPEKWDALSYVRLLDDYVAERMRVPLYILTGDRDRHGVEPHAKALYQTLHELQPALVEYHVVEGDHEWRVWRAALPHAMEYMYQFLGSSQETQLSSNGQWCACSLLEQVFFLMKTTMI